MNGLINKLNSFLAIRSLIKDRLEPIVFLHSSFAGFIGRLALIGVKVKAYYIPHCISFMRKDISQLKKVIFLALEWVGSLKSCDYIACSASEQIELQKYIPFRTSHLVENAVDINSWSNQVPWLERKKTVITVGQIRTQKNPVQFADICSLSKTLNLGFDFVWVGDGDDINAKELLIKSGVEVAGWKKPEEVKSLLADSQVYLSTALWEGLPVSPLEAMLSGCVSVLSDCAGNRDIINNEQNGFSFTSTDEAISILKRIALEDGLGTNISTLGEEHAKTAYNLERYTKEMDSLISMEK
jgi:glycosyltransferase involved in cell wall biosynthesis